MENHSRTGDDQRQRYVEAKNMKPKDYSGDEFKQDYWELHFLIYSRLCTYVYSKRYKVQDIIFIKERYLDIVTFQ